MYCHIVLVDSKCAPIVRSIGEYTGRTLRTRAPDAALHANQFQLPRRAHYPPVTLSASICDTLVAELLLLLLRVSALTLPSASASASNSNSTCQSSQSQPEAIPKVANVTPTSSSSVSSSASAEQKPSTNTQPKRPFGEPLAALIFTGLEAAARFLREEGPPPAPERSAELDLMLFAVACVTFLDDRLRLGALVRHEKLGVGVVTRILLNGRISVTYAKANQSPGGAGAPVAPGTQHTAQQQQQQQQQTHTEVDAAALVLRAEPGVQPQAASTASAAVAVEVVGGDTKRAMLRLLVESDAERLVRLVQDHCLPLVLSAPLLRRLNAAHAQPTSPLNVVKVRVRDLSS